MSDIESDNLPQPLNAVPANAPNTAKQNVPSAAPKPFVNPGPEAKRVEYLLGANILCSLVHGGSLLIAFSITVFQTAAGKPEDQAAFQLADKLEPVLIGLQFLIAIITAILFLIWMNTVRKNLRALSVRNVHFHQFEVITAFIIPILCLYRPVTMMQETWKASNPSIPPEGNWREIKSSPYITWWWVLFLTDGLINKIMNLMDNGNSDISDSAALRNFCVFLVSTIINITAAVLAIIVVKSITARQQQKHSNNQP